MKPLGGHAVWKNSMVMRSHKEDSEESFGVFSVLLLKIVQVLANPQKRPVASNAVQGSSLQLST